MRRVVQKAVENTVAKQMLAGNVNPGDTVHITLEQVEQAFASTPTQQPIAPSADIELPLAVDVDAAVSKSE